MYTKKKKKKKRSLNKKYFVRLPETNIVVHWIGSNENRQVKSNWEWLAALSFQKVVANGSRADSLRLLMNQLLLPRLWIFVYFQQLNPSMAASADALKPAPRPLSPVWMPRHVGTGEPGRGRGKSRENQESLVCECLSTHASAHLTFQFPHAPRELTTKRRRNRSSSSSSSRLKQKNTVANSMRATSQSCFQLPSQDTLAAFCFLHACCWPETIAL